MAENIVSGLFGLSPYDVQQSRIQDTNAQAFQYAKLDPFQKANMSLYQAGGGLGRIGAGMLGMVDPKEQEAQVAEMGQAQIDHSTPEGLLEGAKMFNQVGNPKMAMMYAQAAQAMEAKNADIAKDKAYSNYYNRDMTQSGLSKLNQKDFTPESFAIFLETGNRADLVPIAKDYTLAPGATRMSGGNGVVFTAPAIPFDPRFAPAPSTTEIINPNNPKETLTIDARQTNEEKIKSGDKTGIIGVKKADTTDIETVDMGLPRPINLPWSRIGDEKSRAVMQRNIYANDSKILEKDKENAKILTNFSADADRFVDLNKLSKTGSIADKFSVGKWVTSLGADNAEMQSITAKTAPNMRPQGAGSTSNWDASQYERATLSVEKPGTTNQNIAKAMKARAQNENDFVDFRQAYLEQNQTLAGADKYWDAYSKDNPIFDNKKPGSLQLNRNRMPWRDYFLKNSANTNNVIKTADDFIKAQK